MKRTFTAIAILFAAISAADDNGPVVGSRGGRLALHAQFDGADTGGAKRDPGRRTKEMSP